MIVLIDNYDSFTYNLVHYLGVLGTSCAVYRNDKITIEELRAIAPQAIVLSPGPCDPDKAGICLELIEAFAEETPILGVCLGHQSIGQAFGGKIIRAPRMMHGKLSAISHEQQSVFKDLPNPFQATRYHSLTVERETLPAELQITATSDDGLIMGLCHKEYPLHGVQFHPESIASEHGYQLLANFLDLAQIKTNTKIDLQQLATQRANIPTLKSA